MDIVTRVEWGARAPKSITLVDRSERRYFIVHYSAATPRQTVRSIQDYHMDVKGWSDIGYNFLCDHNGRLYMGRGWDRLGTHTVGYNRTGIACCFIGRDADVTAAAKTSIRWLAEEASRLMGRALVRGGHRDFDQTTCPGDDLWTWVHAGMPIAAPVPAPPIEEDDMKPYLMVRDPATGKVFLCYGSGATRHAGPGEFAALRQAGVPAVDAKATDETARLEAARIDI